MKDNIYWRATKRLFYYCWYVFRILTVVFAWFIPVILAGIFLGEKAAELTFIVEIVVTALIFAWFLALAEEKEERFRS